MMQCNYYLINPTNNITILVESQFPTEVQPFVAQELLKKEKTAEQVGFVSDEKSESFDIKIRMSGGEFCGNACIAAAALFLSKNRTENNFVNVSISGCDKPVKVYFDICNDKEYICTVEMPRAKLVDKIEINDKSYPVVHYDGISHIIIEDKFEKAYSEELIKRLAEKHNYEALGFMFVENEYKALVPLVYVSESKTLYWENSCASGTAALGEYIVNEGLNILPLKVKEPGGVLGIDNKNGIALCGKCIIENYYEAEIK